MKYMIEPIGAKFSDRDVKSLAERFTQRSNEGYTLHSVFHVSQPGCLGVGQGTFTYLAIYQRQE